MEKNPLISKLNKALPGAILETRRFGRSGITSIWLEASFIQEVAEVLKNDTDLKLDWLENLSVVEFEKSLVVTYFVRSSVTPHTFVVRASAEPSSPTAEVAFPSIREIWPMGEPMENEAEEMFGIHFTRKDDDRDPDRPHVYLPEGWKGFPLRKNYVFPKEFLGIVHSRPFNRTSPKKSNS